MKGLIISLTAIALLFFGGQNVARSQEKAVGELPTAPALASSVEQIAGTWHRFPAGLVIQFDADGSAQIGLTRDGTAIGYEAKVWFEEQVLSIQFANYDGEYEACASATGSYTVQLHENGAIRFATVQDDCGLRAEVLSGAAAGGPGWLYHPVQD